MSHVEDKQFVRTMAAQKAATLWAEFDDNQKAAVRIGMFPAEVMRAAGAEGHDEHALCCELMNCANRDGGMIA